MNPMNSRQDLQTDEKQLKNKKYIAPDHEHVS